MDRKGEGRKSKEIKEKINKEGKKQWEEEKGDKKWKDGKEI